MIRLPVDSDLSITSLTWAEQLLGWRDADHVQFGLIVHPSAEQYAWHIAYLSHGQEWQKYIKVSVSSNLHTHSWELWKKDGGEYVYSEGA